MLRHPPAALVVALLLAACSTGPRAESHARNRNLITAEEIAGINVMDAYEAVRQLRPEFLRARGSFSIRSAEGQYPVVYVGGVRYGELNQLRTIRANEVHSIRFIGAADATTRWGTGHAGGVIEVILRS